jgi:hypothetical protein
MQTICALDVRLDFEVLLEDPSLYWKGDARLRRLRKQLEEIELLLEFFARWEQEEQCPPTIRNAYAYRLKVAKGLYSALYTKDALGDAALESARATAKSLRRSLRLIQWEFLRYSGHLSAA